MYILQNNQPALFTTTLQEDVGTWGQVAINTDTQEKFVKLSSGWCKITDDMGVATSPSCAETAVQSKSLAPTDTPKLAYQKPSGPTKIKMKLANGKEYSPDVVDGVVIIPAEFTFVKQGEAIKISNNASSYQGKAQVDNGVLTLVNIGSTKIA